MENLDVRTVPFMGDVLMAAQDNDGQVWAGVSYICSGIGFSKNQKDRQIKNVQEDRVLQRGCVKFDAGVFDPHNETVALKLDYVPLWLAKINITPAMERENPELAEKLVYYQLKAKDVLARAFVPSDERESTDLAHTRMLTVDDYLTAAKLIATCRNERLPYIFGVLKQLGMEIKPATPPLLEAKNREMLQLKSEEEHRYRELADYFIENCDTLGRLKQFGLFYYACVPTTTAREVALKCKVDYRGFLRWARFCGLLRDDGHGFSMSVRFGKTARHCICIKLTDDNKEVM